MNVWSCIHTSHATLMVASVRAAESIGFSNQACIADQNSTILLNHNSTEV